MLHQRLDHRTKPTRRRRNWSPSETIWRGTDEAPDVKGPWFHGWLEREALHCHRVHETEPLHGAPLAVVISVRGSLRPLGVPLKICVYLIVTPDAQLCLYRPALRVRVGAMTLRLKLKCRHREAHCQACVPGNLTQLNPEAT